MRFLLIILFIAPFSMAQDKIDYTNMESLLKPYIYKGYVAYEKWDRSETDKKKLDVLLNYLAKASTKKLSKKDEKALLINIYNLSVIQLVLKNFPVASIMKIDNAFKKKFITYKNKLYSLDELEKGILYKKYKDARLHFALVCAALSCPYLIPDAYKGKSLDKMLDKVSSDFINNPKLNQIDVNEAKVSKIFDWYANHFGGKKNIYKFLNKFLKNKQLTNDTKIEFIPYSWKLNGESSFRSSM